MGNSSARLLRPGETDRLHEPSRFDYIDSLSGLAGFYLLTATTNYPDRTAVGVEISCCISAVAPTILGDKEVCEEKQKLEEN